MTSSSRLSIAAQHKPAELFRSDLISAMKLPDSLPMENGSYFTVKESWRREWEFGVQVCVSLDQMPKPSARAIDDSPDVPQDFRMPPTRFTEENTDSQYVQYDLDDMDINWLERVNLQRKFRALAGPDGLAEDTFRDAIIALETKCQQNMACAVATNERLGIEYDEGTVCDICRDRECEDTNDMIFCDACNLCVHQACYGVATIPKGRWLCKTCSVGEKNVPCLLCLNIGGALKRVRPGNTNWAHLSCALWIPEVKIGNAEKMEPITNTEDIPPSRWNLVCCVCRRKQGACVQCSHPHCVTAYHITCAFSTGLETHTRLDMRTNGVIHESYCPKHSPLHRSPTKFPPPSPLRNSMTHYSQLQQVHEQFYTYTSPDHLVSSLSLPPKICVLIYNYWKLKRMSFHSRPLLSHLPIETVSAGLKAELALSRQFGLEGDPNFIKIIYIRQNLEKVRNLVYMVQRRERLKTRIMNCQQEMVDLEAGLLEAGLLDNDNQEEMQEEDDERDVHDGNNIMSGEEMEESEMKKEGQDDETMAQHSIRLTRSMTHKTESEPHVLSPSHLSPTLSPLHNPLLPHQSHKPTTFPPITSTCNHTPSSTSSKFNPQLTVPLLPIYTKASYTVDRPDVYEIAGGHVTSHDDHMTSSVSHMTLRKRDTQSVLPMTTVPTSCTLTLPQDTNKLTRPKIRHQVVVTNGNCSPPTAVKKLTQLSPPHSRQPDEPVLRTSLSPPSSGPASNLRFRPYTLGKT